MILSFFFLLFSVRIKMYPDPLNTHPGRENPHSESNVNVKSWEVIHFDWNSCHFNYQGLEPNQPFTFL